MYGWVGDGRQVGQAAGDCRQRLYLGNSAALLGCLPLSTTAASPISYAYNGRAGRRRLNCLVCWCVLCTG